MINSTLPNLKNRQGLGDVISQEAAPAAEHPTALPKSQAKFTDHLLTTPGAAKAALLPKSEAKANPKLDPNPTRSAPGGRSDPKDRDSKAALARSAQPNTTSSPLAKPSGPAKAAELRGSIPNTKNLKAPANGLKEERANLDARELQRPGSKGAATHTNPGQKPAKAASSTAKPSASGMPMLIVQPNDLPAADEAALDGIALDQSQDEDASWEKRLADVLMFMGIPPSSLQQDLPSLAILTGQLQYVEPEAIPSTLAESPMLNHVLASADPAAVIEEVKPLGAWLDDMGWSPDGLIVKDPVAFQDLMNTPVSLKDLMKTFQVDPDKVVTEAKNLQASLPLEGAASLMARATALQADRPAARAQGPETIASIKDESIPESEFLGALMQAALQNAPGNQGTSAGGQASDSLGKIEGPAPLSKLDQLLAAMGNTGNGSAVEGLPKASLLNPGAFQTMELRSSETFLYEPNAVIEDSPVLSRMDSRDWLENIQAISLQADTAAPLAGDKARAFDPSLILERMNEAGLGGGSDQQRPGDSEPGEDFVDTLASDQAPGFLNGATQKSSGAFQLEMAEAPTASSAPQLHKAVAENTQMLIKDDGGSMRIDIGNKELGAIDLAVEVKDNKVEIKIVAASLEAREMLAVELPALKANLQNQNLNLSKVEIGLSGGSSWTSSDHRSSGREASSQKDEIFGVPGTSRKSSRSYRQVSSTQNLQPEVIRDGGSIKVRV